jgi:hypothetical protein
MIIRGSNDGKFGISRQLNAGQPIAAVVHDKRPRTTANAIKSPCSNQIGPSSQENKASGNPLKYRGDSEASSTNGARGPSRRIF